MKPAPATSVRATSSLGGSAAAIAAASSRGERRAALASRSATLLAKSPCWASRVRSTPRADGAGISGRMPPASFCRAASSSCSSSCFKMRSSAANGARSLPESTRGAAVSEELERIDVERPAHALRALLRLDPGEPGIQKLVQRRALAALDEELCVVAPGALRHRRGHGAEEPHAAWRTACGGARLGEETERRLARGARGAQRRQAAERRPGGLAPLLQRGRGEAVVPARE